MARTRTRTSPADRREADAALYAAADVWLIGDDAPDDELAGFLAGRPALERLSLKNCALLAEQADERGDDVSDVRTFKGWLEAGRVVAKGSKAYKLTVPRRTDEPGAEGADESKADDEAPKRPRFFLKAAWFDVSQTVAADIDEA